MSGNELTTTEASESDSYFREPLPSSFLGRIAAKPEIAPSPGLAAPLMVIGAFLTGYQAFRLGGINVTLADLTFAAAFGLCAWNGRISLQPFRALTPFWLVGLALILTGLMISTAVNGDMVRWAVISGQYLFGYLILPMMLLSQPEALSRRMVLAFILGMVVLEACGIVVSLTMDHAQASNIFSQEFLAGNGRVSSFASEPNWNGELIAMTFPLLIFCYAKRMVPFWAFAVAAALLAWGLLLSASVTGFVATTISITITLLFLGLRQLLGALAIVAVAGSLYFASGAPLPAVFQDRVGNALAEGDIQEAGTFTGRIELIRQAWEAGDDTFFVGYGVEGFRETNAVRQPVHNLFLLMLVDGGALAFLGLVVLAGTLVLTPLCCRSASRASIGTALAVVTVFLIYTQSSPHMFSRLNINPVMFALILLYLGNRGATQKA